MTRPGHRYPPVTEAALLHTGLAESLLTTLAFDQTVLSGLGSLRKMRERWQADYDAVRAVEPILEKARAEAGRPPVAMRPHTCTTAHMAGIWASVALEDLVSGALEAHAVAKKDLQRLAVLRSSQPFDFFALAADHVGTIVAAAKKWELPEVRGLYAEIRLESHYLSQKEANGTPPAQLAKQEPMLSLGDRNYTVGQNIQTVELNEDIVLQAFFRHAASGGRWIALDQKRLRNESGYETAPRILKGIKKKYPVLASVIDCPGKRGRGGLKIYAAISEKHRKK